MDDSLEGLVSKVEALHLAEDDVAIIDRHDLRLVGIKQTALVIGFGPSQSVAGVDFERLHFEQAQRIELTLRAKAARQKLETAPAGVLQRDALA